MQKMDFCRYGDNLMVFWDHCGTVERNWDLNQVSWVLVQKHVTISKSLDLFEISLSSLVKWGLTKTLKFCMVFWLLTALNEVALKFQHINVSPKLLIRVEANPLQWSWPCWPPCIALVVQRLGQKGKHLESPSRQLGKAFQRTLS